MSLQSFSVSARGLVVRKVYRLIRIPGAQNWKLACANYLHIVQNLNLSIFCYSLATTAKKCTNILMSSLSPPPPLLRLSNGEQEGEVKWNNMPPTKSHYDPLWLLLSPMWHDFPESLNVGWVQFCGVLSLLRDRSVSLKSNWTVTHKTCQEGF